VRYVPHAAIRPHRCAVIPFIGNHNSRGFIDTGMDLPGWDPHVYVSVEAVEQMAGMIGWQPAHVSQQGSATIKSRDARIAELEAERDALTEQLGAVQVLKQAGYVQAKRPGKPRKTKVAANV
jgi:hypothetical protein